MAERKPLLQRISFDDCDDIFCDNVSIAKLTMPHEYTPSSVRIKEFVFAGKKKKQYSQVSIGYDTRKCTIL
jgi:hypothetical protein